MTGIVFLIFFCTFIAGMFIIPKKLKKKRIEQLKNLALKIGFSYRAELPQQTLSSLESLNLQKTGHCHWGYNISEVLEGTRRDISWTVFHFHFRSGGSSAHPENQTVAYGQLKNFSFPKFSLGVRNMPETGASELGKAINFPEYRRFSTQLVVRGQDEAKIRQLFTPAVIKFFEDKAKEQIKMSFSAKMMNLKAEGNNFLFYYSGRTVKPQDLLNFLDEVAQFIQIFTQQ